MRLEWTAPKQWQPTAYEVVRDGVQIAVRLASELESTAIVYEDWTAAAGELSAPPSVTASQGTLLGKVELSWTEPSSAPGPFHKYTVVALTSPTGRERSQVSNTAEGQRAAPTIVGYEFSRDSGSTWQSAGTSTHFVDTEPLLQRVSTAPKVEFDPARGVVVLNARPTFAPPASLYHVRAVAASGPGQESETRLGYAAADFSYQWQRSLLDRNYPFEFVKLDDVTGSTWLDRDPALNTGRYYRVAVTTEHGQVVAISSPTSAQAFALNSISAGERHTCGLRIDGAVACWGDYWAREVPYMTSLPFRAISAGYRRTCGYTDEALFCWSYDETGTRSGLPLPGEFISISARHSWDFAVRKDGTAIRWEAGNVGSASNARNEEECEYKSVAAGFYHVCMLRSNNTVWCTESEMDTRLTAPTDERFESVTVGEIHACGIRVGGTVKCWGDNSLGQVAAAPSTDLFKSLSAGRGHTCGVSDSGSVVCWGINEVGQAPPMVLPGPFASVTAGWYHTCGLRTDGRASCWGGNASGQAPTEPPSDRFSVVSAETEEAVSAGSFHTCGVRANDKAIVCWGYTADGRGLSAPSTESFRSVSAGKLHTCGLQQNGKLTCWQRQATPGQVPHDPPEGLFDSVSAGEWHTCGIRKETKRVVCWGNNDYGQASAPATDLFTSVSAAKRHTCGVAANGKVACWGDDEQLTHPPLDSFQSISAGDLHTCGIRVLDQTVACWGDNAQHQLDAPAHERFASLSAGGFHTCGVRMDGKVVCWGANQDGQASTEQLTDTFDSVSAGAGYTCGVRRQDQKIICWGNNSHGQAPRP